MQTLLKLFKEIFTLLKGVFEVLAPKKKDSQASDPSGAALLLNSVLPPAFKLLALFQQVTPKQTVYDRIHYKYLRATSAQITSKIQTLNLQYLNPVLLDLAPNVYGPLSKVATSAKA